MSAGERRPFDFRQRGSGWSAEGPGFYVWDEDAKEATGVALRLVAQSRRSRPDPQAPPEEPAPEDPMSPPARRRHHRVDSVVG